ncbi:MAG: caspase family protein [Gemmataceae bacterium]
MNQVVQARCPHCRRILRVPAAWLNQVMRCTFCKRTFQTLTRGPAAAPPPPVPASLKATPLPPPGRLAASPLPPPAARPPAPPVSVAAPAGGPPAAPAGADALSFIPPGRSKAPRAKGRWLPALLLWGGVLAVAAVLGILAWPEISNLFQGKPEAKEKVASKDKKDTDKERKDGTEATTDKSERKDKKGGKGPTDKSAPPSPTDKTVISKEGKAPVKDRDPPKKVEDPPEKEKVDDPPPKKKDPPVVVKGGSGEFPRRALLINVSNYLLFNPLYYGQDKDGKRPGGSTGAVARRLTLPPMNFPPSQVFELADGKRPGSHPTTKTVIEAAITDFATTSREQDRILLLFTGHGMEIDGEAYLVPADAMRKDASSLIKVSWVFDQIKASKARQKIVMLDVFRFPPARGEEIDGTGAMTEAFINKLSAAPDGIQVWASCSKDQQSLELENGSLFLQAFNDATKEVKVGIAQPEEAVPIVELLPLVNKIMKDRLSGDKAKLEQVSLMLGKELDGKAYDKKEALAAEIEFKEAGSGDPALRKIVRSVVDDLNLLGPIRGKRPPVAASSLFPFVTEKIKAYDGESLKEVEKTVLAAKDKYPLRAAYFEAIDLLKECATFPIKDYQPGPVTDALKKQIEALQKDVPGLLDFKLKALMAKMEEVHDNERDKETSKRWLANFDYARAMIAAKRIYLNEYNYLLAGIRGRPRPGAGGRHRLGASPQARSFSTSENEIALNKKMPKTWESQGLQGHAVGHPGRAARA